MVFEKIQLNAVGIAHPKRTLFFKLAFELNLWTLFSLIIEYSERMYLQDLY